MAFFGNGVFYSLVLFSSMLLVVKYLGHVYSLLTLVMVASYPPPGYS